MRKLRDLLFNEGQQFIAKTANHPGAIVGF